MANEKETKAKEGENTSNAPEEKPSEKVQVLSAKKDKMVKVKAIETHKCMISKNSYSFKKDEDLELPAHVAELLAASRKVVIKA